MKRITKNDFMDVLIKLDNPHIVFPFPPDDKKHNRPLKKTRPMIGKSNVLSLLNKLTDENLRKTRLELETYPKEEVLTTLIGMIKRYKKGVGEDKYFHIIKTIGWGGEYIQYIESYLDKYLIDKDPIKILDCTNLFYIYAKRNAANCKFDLLEIPPTYLHSFLLGIADRRNAMETKSVYLSLYPMKRWNELKEHINSKCKGKIKFSFYDIWEILNK